MFEKHAGAYVLNYDDGSSEEIPLIVGENTEDWMYPLNDDPLTPEPVWKGTSPCFSFSGHGNRIFKMTWENPHPDKKIVSLDFRSSGYDAAPFLLAITVE
jgi:beta-galactosidase